MTPPDTYFQNPEFVALEALFHDYVAQGDGRNITWLVAKTGLPVSTVARGMVAGMWMQRIAAVAREAAKRTLVALATDVSGMNERSVASLTRLKEAAEDKLLLAIEADRVPPATLSRIYFEADEAIVKKLGLERGGEADIAERMKKFIADANSKEAEPFKLNLESLNTPAALPDMPGMISDEEETNGDQQA